MPQVPPLERDEASVDSELACLGLPIPSPAGPIKNPYADKVTPILDSFVEPASFSSAASMLLEGAVRSMIDGAIAAEKTGLWGWAYIDSRGITSGPYLEGDQWLGTAANNLAGAACPFSGTRPRDPACRLPGHDAAYYLGWYDGDVSGPFRELDFRFLPARSQSTALLQRVDPAQCRLRLVRADP